MKRKLERLRAEFELFREVKGDAVKLPHVNLSKLWGALGVVASIIASPAVTDLVSAKVAAIAAAVIYLLKTVAGNPPPAGK